MKKRIVISVLVAVGLISGNLVFARDHDGFGLSQLRQEAARKLSSEKSEPLKQEEPLLTKKVLIGGFKKQSLGGLLREIRAADVKNEISSIQPILS